MPSVDNVKDSNHFCNLRLVPYKHSQSALEYMMTYGWAILIIVIVAAILYYMGIFHPSSYTASSVYGFSGVKVVAQQCVSNIAMFLSLSNYAGNTVEIRNITLSFPNGQVFSDTNLYYLGPDVTKNIFIPGACPLSVGQGYNANIKITYTEPTYAFPNALFFSSGSVSGSASSEANAIFGGLLNNVYVFGTSNVNTSFEITEYFTKGAYLGYRSSPFPNMLSDLKNPWIDCGSPYNTQYYSAKTYMYFSNQLNVQVVINDGFELFYKPISGGNWTSVFNGTLWAGHSSVYFDKKISVKPGYYEVVAVWFNLCTGGDSALSITGALGLSPQWNASAWVYKNTSVQVIPFKQVAVNPFLPQNASVEQVGYWPTNETVSTCTVTGVCETIINIFNLPYNYPRWIDLSGDNITTTNTYAIFNVSSTGNYSLKSAPLTMQIGNCKTYGGELSATGIIPGSGPEFWEGLGANCSTKFVPINLPSGAKWNVTYNGNTNAGTANLTFYPSYGTISEFSTNPIVVSGTKYYPCPSAGYAAYGNTVDINFSKSSSCSQNNSIFNFVNSPLYFNWSVNLSGNKISSIIPNANSLISSAESFKFSPIKMVYRDTGCYGTYYSNVSSGSILPGEVLPLKFLQNLTCISNFTVYGLPSGATWYVKFNNSNKSSTQKYILFNSTESFSPFALSNIPEPELPFIVKNVTYNGVTYYACPSSGVLAFGSDQEIFFSTNPSCNESSLNYKLLS